jgi:aminodeoxyfutalosine synthase
MNTAEFFGSEQHELAQKIFEGQRISEEEALKLFLEFTPPQLSLLATERKRMASQDKVFYNRNIHVEPTNICVYNCRFCSYKAKSKAFTAVEIGFMCRIDNMGIAEGLAALREAGLDSMPGGGAEIFDEEIRLRISPEKPSGQEWLDINAQAHALGIPSNATMLFGHVENFSQRIAHMGALRSLQDKSKGFNAFIPLKFRNRDNRMSDIAETAAIEDMKTYAIARIFLDNIFHLKAYWPAVGRDFAQLSLQFGVDDLDGTINDSTTIYTRAGSFENPAMSTSELRQLILDAGFSPVERDSVYNEIK